MKKIILALTVLTISTSAFANDNKKAGECVVAASILGNTAAATLALELAPNQRIAIAEGKKAMARMERITTKGEMQLYFDSYARSCIKLGVRLFN